MQPEHSFLENGVYSSRAYGMNEFEYNQATTWQNQHPINRIIDINPLWSHLGTADTVKSNRVHLNHRNRITHMWARKLDHHWSWWLSSNGNIFRVTGPLCGEFTGHRWIPLTKASDAELWCFLWSVPWINGWVSNREADDLRRHLAHYDVIVMVQVMACHPFDARLLSKATLAYLEHISMKLEIIYNISTTKLIWKCRLKMAILYQPRCRITVGERTITLKIIARCSITQTPTGQWNIDNVAD